MNGNSQSCGGFNDELAAKFHDFNLGNLKSKVVDCMDTCKTDNNGEEMRVVYHRKFSRWRVRPNDGDTSF